MFEEPVEWRATIIREFGLRGAERCAAASPAPGFPQMLESLAPQLPLDPDGPWLDVGGGAGGIASWIERTYRKVVVVVDPATASVTAARRLFGDLAVAAATGEGLPVRDASVAVALLNGVVSLVDDVDDLLDEVRRVLRPEGRIAITDIWSATAETFRCGPNTFWSLEEIDEKLVRRGLHALHVAVADPSVGWWASAAQQVDDEVVRRHRHDAGFDEWLADRRHLQSVVESGNVVAAGLVSGPPDAVSSPFVIALARRRSTSTFVEDVSA